MDVRFGTAFKLILATIVVVAGMTTALALSLHEMVQLSLIGGAITLGYIVVIGIPVFLILRTKNKLNGLNLAATGFFCGWIPILAMSWDSAGRGDLLKAQAQILVFFGGLGLISALAFGGVWNLLSVKQDKFPWRGRLG